jgi:hypothetical protein
VSPAAQNARANTEVSIARKLRTLAANDAIVGMRCPDQVGAAIRVAAFELTDEDVREIEGGAGR